MYLYSVTKANNSQDKEFATKQDQDAIQGRGEHFLEQRSMVPSKFDSRSSSNSEAQTSNGQQQDRSTNTIPISIHGESSDPGSRSSGLTKENLTCDKHMGLSLNPELIDFGTNPDLNDFGRREIPFSGGQGVSTLLNTKALH